MRIISRSLIGLTTALALTVVACGDSLTGTDSGAELTNAEVAAVVDAFFMAFDSAEAQADSAEAAAAPAQAPATFAGTIDLSVPCESGTFAMSGSFSFTFDDVTLEEDGRIEVTWEPMDCVVGDGTNTFTLDGAPRVEMGLEFHSDAEGDVIDGTVNGGFSFASSDGRSGSCAIDVTLHLEITGQGTSVNTVSGTVCGVNANTIDAFDAIGNDAPTQPA